MDNCKKCGVQLNDENWPPSFRKRYVHRCSKCQYQLQLDYAARNPEQWKLMNRKKQRRYKETHPDYAKTYYWSNVVEHSRRTWIYRWMIKRQVFKMLGGKCVVCGIEDARLLQINHKNGGGSKEGRFGEKMYAAILQGKRSTDDLELRCANHNLLYEYERGNRSNPPAS